MNICTLLKRSMLSKGKAGVEVGNYFPDIKKFVKSVMKAVVKSE